MTRSLPHPFKGLSVPIGDILFFDSAWWGWQFTRFAWNRTSELADLPLWLIHIAWPLAGVTWVLFQGEHLINAVRVLAGDEGVAT